MTVETITQWVCDQCDKKTEPDSPGWIKIENLDILIRNSVRYSNDEIYRSKNHFCSWKCFLNYFNTSIKEEFEKCNVNPE